MAAIKVSVEGEYRFREGMVCDKRPYEAEFTYPNGDDPDGIILGNIRKHLLEPYLKKKVDNFHNVRTCQIVDIQPAEKVKGDKVLTASSISTMSKAELVMFSIQERLGLDVDKLGGVANCRKAVSDSYDDAQYAKKQRAEEKARAAETPDIAANLRELNKDSFED